MTSRMDAAFVRSMARRSRPRPMPPVGGIPYSSAIRKSSSRTTCVFGGKINTPLHFIYTLRQSHSAMMLILCHTLPVNENCMQAAPWLTSLQTFRQRITHTEKIKRDALILP